jgi:biotin operon repressor
MKKRPMERIKNIKDLLTDNHYCSAKDLASKCRLTPSAIYQLIRRMRIVGIGIMTTNKGYILSKYASKKDDVNYLRRLYGRRTSDFISIRAAENDIRSRWNTIQDSRNLKLLIQPLSVDLSKSKGMQILLTESDKLKI